MKSLLIVTLAVQGALAFPAVSSLTSEERSAKPLCSTSKKCDEYVNISDDVLDLQNPEFAAGRARSKARTNCGEFHGPCTIFDAKKQYVSTEGAHRFISPTKGQIRGPCPGLNAAANHGYLSRDGVPSISDTVFGLGQAFGMSPEVGAALAAYAVALDGDIVSLRWSIGGPPGQDLLLASAKGISYSHNKYEGDTSIGRCDAYLNDGDAHSLSTTRFMYAYETGMENDRYTLDDFARGFTKNTVRSIQTNPYYFAPLFSTTIVAPAAYNFVINFMSNHSEEEKSGYLNGAMFKKFFAIEGDYPHFKWNPGQEAFPKNWYRRPASQGYDAGGVVGDVLAEFLAYPNAFRFGGNTNGVNSYTGIDIEKFSGGTFNAKNLLKGDNLGCFLAQTFQQGIPDVVKGKKDAGALGKLLAGASQKFFAAFTCPAMAKIDPAEYSNYPGNSYSPTGKGASC